MWERVKHNCEKKKTQCLQGIALSSRSLLKWKRLEAWDKESSLMVNGEKEKTWLVHSLCQAAVLSTAAHYNYHIYYLFFITRMILFQSFHCFSHGATAAPERWEKAVHQPWGQPMQGTEPRALLVTCSHCWVNGCMRSNSYALWVPDETICHCCFSISDTESC